MDYITKLNGWSIYNRRCDSIDGNVTNGSIENPKTKTIFPQIRIWTIVMSFQNLNLAIIQIYKANLPEWN